MVGVYNQIRISSQFIAVFGFFIYEKLQDQSNSPIGNGLGLFTIITMVVQWAII